MIDPLFVNSPQFEHGPLSSAVGCSLTLKIETANPIRSFKGRGADYFMQKVVERGESRPLVCASTGNFGQAMAYAARSHGRNMTVFADLNANTSKLGRIRDLGAEVRQVGDDFDSAKSAARAHCESAGAWMIEDGREPEISEGAGTIGMELTGSGATFDVVVVPVGNGALINGVARWVKHVSPATEVIGVSASGADAMAESWRSERIVERASVDTIAEGIAVRIPVPEALEDMETIIDDMVLVDDVAMVEAMRLIARTTGQLVEPSGAAGVAAIRSNPTRFEGRTVATVLTGNNLTEDQLARWLG
ncbi:MAG TPA: pyridoxal-phosphate dependent enzyme [Acidimicrobiia bacterium]|nr:pyridoxal-phosphate dependent enzyme [Acidimicrobiia bacterium]